MTIIEKFHSRVERKGPDECWPWLGSTDKDGYGQLAVRDPKRRTLKAHRLAYEFGIGPIPYGLGALHTCDNPPCCNPRHLWAGTQKDNMRDMIAKGRNHIIAFGSGEDASNSRLTESDILAIRSSELPYRTLANRYAVAIGHIQSIRRNKTWKCVAPGGNQISHIRRTHYNQGSAHARSKLTETQVIEIRAMDEMNTVTAARYGVTANLIGAIRRGEVWAHLLPKEMAA